MWISKKAFVLTFLCFACLEGVAKSSPEKGPWMTGPLLAPAGEVVAPHHINWEPYLFINDQFGHFGSNWQVQHRRAVVGVTPQMVVTFGLVPNFDFQASIPYVFKHEGNESYHHFKDIQLILGAQALRDDPHGFCPDLRVTVTETMPAGRYNDFNFSLRRVEGTGSGSYVTSFALNFQKLLHLSHRFLRARLSLTYSLPASVKVSNYNSYGGGEGTSGTVDPGNIFSADFSLEYTLTQRWVPALDVVYTVAGSNLFKGIRGASSNGQPAAVGRQGESVQFSLAPALEYNFSAELGVIAGAWFAVTGENSTDFESAVIAVNYYT